MPTSCANSALNSLVPGNTIWLDCWIHLFLLAYVAGLKKEMDYISFLVANDYLFVYLFILFF